ncbi:MAG: hypothetical protein Q4C64_00205 [Erysipelotrichia bacterium]|nr:hypothetical protein [Erysipelotrichia bacterium]
MKETIEKKYIEKKRLVKKVFRNELVEYVEVYYVDSSTNEEVYFKAIEKENKLRYLDAYKAKIGLLTSEQIKNIRKKYDLSQREYSFALGLGEITVHRYEKGAIQSFGDNQLLLLSKDAKHFLTMINENQDCFDSQRYEEIVSGLQKYLLLEKHRIVSLDELYRIKGSFVTADVEDIAAHIYGNYQKNIIDGSEMNVMKMQKMLYYLQGLSVYYFNCHAFEEDFYTSENGPYLKGLNSIPHYKEKVYLSEGMYHLCELLISAYGKYECSYLAKLSLEEFGFDGKEKIISIENIKRYFKSIYQ